MEIPGESTFSLGRKKKSRRTRTALPRYSTSECPDFLAITNRDTPGTPSEHRVKTTTNHAMEHGFNLASVCTPLAEGPSALMKCTTPLRKIVTLEAGLFTRPAPRHLVCGRKAAFNFPSRYMQIEDLRHAFRLKRLCASPSFPDSIGCSRGACPPLESWPSLLLRRSTFIKSRFLSAYQDSMQNVELKSRFVLLNLTTFELNVTVPFSPMRRTCESWGHHFLCDVVPEISPNWAHAAPNHSAFVVSLAPRLHPSRLYLLHSNSFRLV